MQVSALGRGDQLFNVGAEVFSLRQGGFDATVAKQRGRLRTFEGGAVAAVAV